MQIAALNATYLNKESVPAADIEKKKEILVAQIKNDPKNANKPDAIVQKKWWMAGSANSMRTTA